MLSEVETEIDQVREFGVSERERWKKSMNEREEGETEHVFLYILYEQEITLLFLCVREQDSMCVCSTERY